MFIEQTDERLSTVVADASVAVVVGGVERGVDLVVGRRLTAVDLRHHRHVLAGRHEPVAVHVELVEHRPPDLLAGHTSQHEQQVAQSHQTAVTRS